jgi:hypothetical protein
MSAEQPALDAEDAKIVTLARSARSRNRAPEGAAVRDSTGRTYTAATVALPSLSLSALEVAVAMAVSSGADRLEAAAIVSEAGSLADADVAAALDLKVEAVLLAGPDGSVISVTRR